MSWPTEAQRIPEPVYWVGHRLIRRDGTESCQQEPVMAEHSLDIYLQDRLTMRLVCTPQYLPELVLGRLCTEGIIRRAEEVSGLTLSPEGREARVTLARAGERPSSGFVEVTPTTGAGSQVLNDAFVRYEMPEPLPALAWRPEQIFALADRFRQGTPLHRQTWAAHSCFLARGDQLLFQCEDIGRHNALDKAIGYALTHGVDLGCCMVYSSGRIAADMAIKAIRAGIPLLASKAAPTREAIALAGRWGLTLIGGARPDSLKVYC